MADGSELLEAVKRARAALTAPGSPFAVGEAEIRGRPVRVWSHAPASLRDVLLHTREHGDNECLVLGDERLTYADTFARTAALANAFRDRFGVGKGDRVAIAMRNLPEFAIAFWAATAIGAIAVPLNAWWTGEELAYGLADCGARVLIADGERLKRLAPYRDDLSLGVVAARSRDSYGFATSGFDDLAHPRGYPRLPDAALAPEDRATIFYTSGTTGRPKGALGTHRNICSTLWATAFGLALGRVLRGEPPAPPPGQKTTLVSLPLFHAMGCHSTLVVQSFAGNRMVLMRRWDAAAALDLIERERINAIGGVPAMMWQLVEASGFERRDLSCVERVSFGGAPAAPELILRLAARFPAIPPGTGYGMTETSSPATSLAGELFRAYPDSVGLALPVCDIRAFDEAGRELPDGTRGELWIRGPNVVDGYWNNPAATAETFPDGWVRTGDIGRVDPDGLVYILDRAKDMLIRGGENVYCVEVENALFAHPDVIEAAVVGLPHKVLGEEVGAVVHLRPGARASEQDLKDHVAARLAAFKVPVRIDIRADDLPRNATGKVLKDVLRRELAGDRY